LRPRRLEESGHDNAAAPGGGTVSRGAKSLVGPTAGLCGLPKLQGIGPDQLKRTDREKKHTRRGNIPTTTHRWKEQSEPNGGRGEGRALAAGTQGL
jgi:hypothetical protein